MAFAISLRKRYIGAKGKGTFLLNKMQLIDKKLIEFQNNRIWWVTSFILSICLCGYSIQHIWEKWYERPIVMSLNEKEFAISEIPFPTVTICPEIKTTRNKLDLNSAYNLLVSNAQENLTDIEWVTVIWKKRFWYDNWRFIQISFNQIKPIPDIVPPVPLIHTENNSFWR